LIKIKENDHPKKSHPIEIYIGKKPPKKNEKYLHVFFISNRNFENRLGIMLMEKSCSGSKYACIMLGCILMKEI